MLQDESWLDRRVSSIARTLDAWIALMSTPEFWGIVAVCATVMGFMIAAGIMMINFNVMRMRYCFNASNTSAFVMLNAALFFVLGGVMAIGEAFNYFDNKKRGIPHKIGTVFWLVIVTITLGSVGLVMLKISC
jgi:hypothetical protein